MTIQEERDLYWANAEEIWKFFSINHNLHLLESEQFDLWLATTRSCRDKICELEAKLQLVRKPHTQIAHTGVL